MSDVLVENVAETERPARLGVARWLRGVAARAVSLLQSHRALLVWAGVLLVILTWGAWTHRYGWQQAQGWESEWIAQSLATGHGYSFPPGRRWLFQNDPLLNNDYYPTAWKEPVYPVLMAVAFKLFRDYWGRFVIVSAQAIFLLLTAVMLYLLGRRFFNVWSGMVAGFILLIQPHVHRIALDNLLIAPLAGLMVTVSAFLVLWCLEAPSVRRASVVGVVLGLCVLTSGATMLFLPISVVLLLGSAGSWRRLVWRPALACSLAAAAVLSPWVVRNYLVFGAFIPARTGFGEIAHVGNSMIAETFVAGFRACGDASAPPWMADNAREAILQMRDPAKRLAVSRKARGCISRSAPPDYQTMNEAQRDRLYLRESVAFVRDKPGVFLQLVVHKALAYFYIGWSDYLRGLSLLALVGVFLTIRRRSSKVLVAWVLAYSVPYVLGMSFFIRYRYPVEPLLLLFAVYPIVAVASYSSSVEQGHEAPVDS